jgi:hypothetical protein
VPSAAPQPELTAAYEALRAYALGTAPSDQPPVGLSILLRRGLAAWLDGWKIRPLPITPPPDPSPERSASPLALITPPLRPDVVLVLASMALSNGAGVAR